MIGRGYDVRANGSIPELLQQLTMETTALLRQEIELAKVELNEQIERIRTCAGAFAAAAILWIGAFGALTAFLIWAHVFIVPAWAAALIVAVGYGVGAMIAFASGRSRLGRAPSLVPQQTT